MSCPGHVVSFCRPCVTAWVTSPAGRSRGRAGLAVSTTSGALADLVQSGIVSLEPFANSHGNRLNREHLLARAIIDMAAAPVVLTKKLKGQAGGWAIQPVAGWL